MWCRRYQEDYAYVCTYWLVADSFVDQFACLVIINRAVFAEDLLQLNYKQAERLGKLEFQARNFSENRDTGGGGGEGGGGGDIC